MQGRPIVTVFIPTYNRARFLRDALTCLRLQTLSHDALRIVVADNASPDDTAGVVRAFSDLNIVYVRRESNLGAMENWLGAREFFDTTYFHFLSDDDLLAPWHLEHALKQMERFPELGAFGGAHQYGTGLWSRDLMRADFRLGDQKIDWNDQLCHWSREQWLAAHSIISAVGINSTLFRTEVLSSINPLFDPELPIAVVDCWLMARVGATTSCMTTPWVTSSLRAVGGNIVHGRSDLWVDGTIPKASRMVALRVLDLARDNGHDLPLFWRTYLEGQGHDRDDIRKLIHETYPDSDARGALGDWNPNPSPMGRLDRLGVPEPVKRRIRGAKTALLG